MELEPTNAVIYVYDGTYMMAYFWIRAEAPKIVLSGENEILFF